MRSDYTFVPGWYALTRGFRAYQPEREAPLSRLRDLPKWMFSDVVHTHRWLVAMTPLISKTSFASTQL